MFGLKSGLTILLTLAGTAPALACETSDLTLVPTGLELSESTVEFDSQGVKIFGAIANVEQNSAKISFCVQDDGSLTTEKLTIKSFGQNRGEYQIGESKNLEAIAFGDESKGDFFLRATNKADAKEQFFVTAVTVEGKKAYAAFALKERNGRLEQAFIPQATVGLFQFGDALTDNPCALAGGNGPYEKVFKISKLTINAKVCEFVGTSGTYAYKFIELGLVDQNQVMRTNFAAPITLKGQELESALKLDISHHNYDDKIVLALPFATYTFGAHTVYAEGESHTSLEVTDKEGKRLYSGKARCHIFKDRNCPQ